MVPWSHGPTTVCVPLVDRRVPPPTVVRGRCDPGKEPERQHEDPHQGWLPLTAAGASEEEETRSSSGAGEEPALPSLGCSETHSDSVLRTRSRACGPALGG